MAISVDALRDYMVRRNAAIIENNIDKTLVQRRSYSTIHREPNPISIESANLVKINYEKVGWNVDVLTKAVGGKLLTEFHLKAK